MNSQNPSPDVLAHMLMMKLVIFSVFCLLEGSVLVLDFLSKWDYAFTRLPSSQALRI
jgi:hypothetical protein